MEVSHFINSLFMPLMFVTTYHNSKRYMTLDSVNLSTVELWEETTNGVCIPNLVSFDIGFGYEIRNVTNQDLMVSLICTRPSILDESDEFFDNPTNFFNINDNIRRQISSFFHIYDNPIEYTIGKYEYPLRYVEADDWSYRMYENVKIVPRVFSNSKQLMYGVVYE